MAIGPRGPLLKNDGPRCRVCGCTEHNACVMLAVVLEGKKKNRAREVTMSCSWVKVEGSTDPLCSACSGTAEDLLEAMTRSRRMLRLHGAHGIGFAIVIADAARRRFLRKASNRS